MLNGTHSLLAYLGALRGYETIAEAVADAELADAAQRLMREDVAPTLAQPPGLDVTAYGETVLERFANPALRHRTTQVAMDGSQKLPLRLLGTVRDRLAAGATPEWASLAVAAWMAYVAVGPRPARARRCRSTTRSPTGCGRRWAPAPTPSPWPAGCSGVREVFG